MAAAEKGEGGRSGAELWQKSHIQRGTGLSLGGSNFSDLEDPNGF